VDGAPPLVAGVLMRGALVGNLKKYPLFIFYIGCVLLKEVVGLSVLPICTQSLQGVIWPAELATIVASYAVIRRNFQKVPQGITQGSRVRHQTLLLGAFWPFAVSYASYRPSARALRHCDSRHRRGWADLR